MLDTGFISLHRSLIKWEWYDDINTTRLFIHLLLTVNWDDVNWHGEKIDRGSRITSLGHLAKETKLSVKQVRLALQKLKNTGEVACKTTNKYTLITIVNYNKFQDMNYKKGKQTGTQRANKGQQLNNINKEIIYFNNSKKKNFDNFSKTTEFTQEENKNMNELKNKYLKGE